MTDEKFSFKFVTKNLVRKEIMKLDSFKATPNDTTVNNEINC